MAGEDKNYLLEQLSTKKPRMLAGVQAILRDEVIFKGFERALFALSTAKDTTWLLKAEAALQTTMSEVVDLNRRDSQYMNDAKAALYLSTLQDMISCLGSWQFENGKENNYVPEIERKFNEVLMEAAQIGIDPVVVQDLCFNKEYKNKSDDPSLANFEFLDAARIKDTKQKLKQYEVTNNPEIFNTTNATVSAEMAQPAAVQIDANQAAQDAQPAPEMPVENAPQDYRDHGVVQCQESSTELIDKVIGIVSERWGGDKVNYDYIVNNLGEFVNIMEGVVPMQENQRLLGKLVKAVTDRVHEYDQIKLATAENAQQATDDMTMGRV